jgi:hypothetical protein
VYLRARNAADLSWLDLLGGLLNEDGGVDDERWTILPGTNNKIIIKDKYSSLFQKYNRIEKYSL